MKRVPPLNTTEFDDSIVIERQDGFYVKDKQTGEESGPYPTFPDAVASMESNAGAEIDPQDDLKDVEEELGIADWIDPDTGSLAEESVPHIEDN